jgi:hypothetical protein
VCVMDGLERSGLAAVDVDVDVDVCGRVWAARGCCLALELRRFGRGPVAQAQLGSAPTALGHPSQSHPHSLCLLAESE